VYRYVKEAFFSYFLPFLSFRNLCDMNQEGKLNPEQFALAMYLVQQKQAGKDPPAALTPDMVPPSMRPKGAAGGGVEAGKSVYNNPELEAMARYVPPSPPPPSREKDHSVDYRLTSDKSVPILQYWIELVEPTRSSIGGSCFCSRTVEL
jgi:hypothetical protein